MSESSQLQLRSQQRIDKIGTALREEFRRWDVIFDSHFKANEALIASYTERLISVEERLSDLERK